MTGGHQHVEIPAAFRFRPSELSIRRDARTGEIILSEIPPLAGALAVLDAAAHPEGFLDDADRDHRPPEPRPSLDLLFADANPAGPVDS